MKTTEYNSDLFSFLKASPTPFHGAENIGYYLQQQGFTQLHENKQWNLLPENSYYVIRENSAIIGFTLGSTEDLAQGFRIIAAHTDSPSLQIKPKPDIRSGSYQQLGVEVYGGCLLAPWFDRDLSLAGRICCRVKESGLKVFLIDFKTPLVTIPSVAIHLNRDANTNANINKQNHLPPVLSLSVDGKFTDFTNYLLSHALKEYPDSQIEEILSHDIFCYENQGPLLTGAEQELISSPRLDNLLSCHAAMMAITHCDRSKNSLIFCANHEENGSLSTTGAQGSFISTVFERIIPNPDIRHISLHNSFLVSADNAHATHPNYLDTMDKSHEIHLNMGPVVKINSNQRYATNCVSSAIFKEICKKAGTTAQEFVMKSDMPCGSTIGPMTAAKLGIRTIDVGAPTLGMHSIREITGSKDPDYLFTTLREFVQSDIHKSLN